MDVFLAACQGTGLALAAGVFSGASGRRGAIGALLLAAAAIGGAALFGISLAEEDHPAWPGLPVGALLAGFAFVVARDVSEGAAARPGGGGATEGLIALAGLALAALSILAPPVGLLALAALAWLMVARRRRAARKHEGLRTLR